jgi:RNA polymerase sigma-70 factor (ECF subfamily)
LFDAYHHRVFSYLYRLVGSPDAARDLTQDVFLRVTRSAAPAEPADGLRGWVFTIARNVALNHLRDRRREPAGLETAAGPIETHRPATQELGAALREALASLPAIDRDVFLMRESAGLGYEEIAAICGLTPDAVRSRIFRARVALRDRLGPWMRENREGGVRWRAGDRRHDGSRTARSD